MAAHRFYAGPGGLDGLAEGALLTLRGEAAHRISRVLRMRRGDRIAIFADGREFEAELLQAGASVEARLLQEALPEPAERVLTLYQALIRPNRLEWLIEKTTELGVSELVPLVTAHSAQQDVEIGPTRYERWERIAIEASEQCGRRRPARVARPITFATAFAQATGTRIFAWEGLRQACPGQALQGIRASDECSLFIGPEGGWSDEEVVAARAAGAVFLALGSTVLRSETAAIAATALLQLAQQPGV